MTNRKTNRKTTRKRSAAQDRLCTPEEVADRLVVSAKTLANWRSSGVGPAYARIGGRVRYRDADIAAWIDAQGVAR